MSRSYEDASILSGLSLPCGLGKWEPRTSVSRAMAIYAGKRETFSASRDTSGFRPAFHGGCISWGPP